MAIKLDILKNRKNTDSYRRYSYADIHFDLDLNSLLPSTPVGANKNAQDLKLDYDSNAIYNSVKNIFNISKENGELIGTTIYEELPLHEPRATVDTVTVVAVPDQNEYKINISITIPSLNNQKGSIDGSLTKEGFKY